MTTPDMDVKRKEFYQGYRKYFENRLTQGQVDSYEAIFNEYDRYEDDALKAPAPYNRRDVLKAQLAYILATAYHEVGPSMQPLREGPASRILKGELVSDEEARAHVNWMYRKGIISRDYAKPDPETGQSYYGRGFVQLTHKENYRKVGEMLGLGNEFVLFPDSVLRHYWAARILVFGMAKGIFTGHGLFRYINSDKVDYYHARRIINGMDRAAIIAGYAERFEKIIQLS